MIAIVDTGGANHSSIQNALSRLGQLSMVTVDMHVLNQASHLILPGVGHAEVAMNRLHKAGLVKYLREQSKPLLGICLGMQILFAKSEEGNVQGLNLFSGTVTKMTPQDQFRVPHMGWSELVRTERVSRLLEGIPEKSSFYFVHSFKVPTNDATVALAQAPVEIPAIIEHKNIVATQFHPERSGEVGSRLLQNFLHFRGGQ